MIAFTIPGRPKAWQRAVDITDPRDFTKRIRINPKEMKQHQKMVGQLAALAMRGHAQMTGPLKLEMLCVYAIPRSWPAEQRQAALDGKVWKTTVPDLDNLEKLIADACNKIVYSDDAQIVRKTSGKRYGSPERTEVRISVLDVLDDHSSRGAFKSEAERRAGQISMALDPSNACNTQSGGSD
jgi:Holliday junction resolvase RusA-like endonuclease